MNGGRIWVDSQTGQGARFHFTLLAANDAEESSETAAPPAGRMGVA
jgi:signal transduction histidine kinase